jgi:hypothetical protein
MATTTLAAEVAALPRLTTPELRRRYEEAFGEEPSSTNKVWLVRRLAWRLQARALGGLSERARRRANELADDADLRITPPPHKTAPAAEPPRVVTIPADDRLPPPGTALVRRYKGRDVQVLVRADGFELDGVVYPSLSAAAKAATGSHCNGFAFFRLAGKNGGDR